MCLVLYHYTYSWNMVYYSCKIHIIWTNNAKKNKHIYTHIYVCVCIYIYIYKSTYTFHYSLLCCMNQTPNSKLMQLWIFIHHNYVLIHFIAIMIQKNLLCVTQFHLLYVHFSLHYSIQSATVMQWNRQPAQM